MNMLENLEKLILSTELGSSEYYEYCNKYNKRVYRVCQFNNKAGKPNHYKFFKYILREDDTWFLSQDQPAIFVDVYNPEIPIEAQILNVLMDFLAD